MPLWTLLLWLQFLRLASVAILAQRWPRLKLWFRQDLRCQLGCLWIRQLDGSLSALMTTIRLDLTRWLSQWPLQTVVIKHMRRFSSPCRFVSLQAWSTQSYPILPVFLSSFTQQAHWSLMSAAQDLCKLQLTANPKNWYKLTVTTRDPK